MYHDILSWCSSVFAFVFSFFPLLAIPLTQTLLHLNIYSFPLPSVLYLTLLLSNSLLFTSLLPQLLLSFKSKSSFRSLEAAFGPSGQEEEV